MDILNKPTSEFDSKSDLNQTANKNNSNMSSLFRSNTTKFVMIGVLTLALLIPLQYVKSLIAERTKNQQEVTSDINEKWGEKEYICGPILKVPYEDIILQKTRYAYFFPDQLNCDVNAEIISLHRNIYNSVVFTSNAQIKGAFVSPHFQTEHNASNFKIHWNEATVILINNSLKSIKDEVDLNWGGRSYVFGPTYGKGSGNTEILETPALGVEEKDMATTTPFHFNIKYDGSENISIVPLGKVTNVALVSNWGSPSFSGNFLPDNKTKEITKDGFKASWKILQINRAFPQQFYEKLPDLSTYAFGVNFVVPVDEYSKIDKASKYGFLIIGLTFLIFFLIQMVSKINIHPFQYCMIGLALVLFFTLLTAITEHSNFILAYLISTAAVVAMITAYSISILKNYKFPVFIGLGLSALYAFVLVIIHLENYALLVGSVGLFLILGIIMFISRKIDWSNK